MNSSGQEVKEEVEANTADEAIAKIRSKGYFPTKVKEKAAKKAAKKKGKGGGEEAPTSPKKKMPISIGGVPRKQLVAFTRQLSTLQDAGLPILRSLQILEQQQKPGLLKAIIGGVADEVEGGGTLSDAMAKYPKAFDKLYVNMINAGEAGGVLDLILARLADFMEKAAKLKKKVIGAMIYPGVVISIAVGIVSMIMIFVIPKFEAIFNDFGTKLPTITQLLLDVSRWFANWGWLYIVASPIVFSLAWRLIRTSEGGKYVTDAIKLKIPILGNILGKTAIARFTRTLGTLISAGVPILDALNITKETCGNEVYSRALAKVHDAIREGESMADPLRATKVCDAIVINMIDVGEETGDLDKMLMKVADNYDSDVDVLVGSLISILEPVMVVVLGVIVGFIVIALFMPMISLIQNISSSGGGKK
ncbi:MAG TPA: type II secretion system F family protein [Tepidisphaeraceae bacterium]|nr:type II secretion system F family protein [Tepidisphaeraceae bacterium]